LGGEEKVTKKLVGGKYEVGFLRSEVVWATMEYRVYMIRPKGEEGTTENLYQGPCVSGIMRTSAAS